MLFYFPFSGNENADRILRTLLGNANLTGALLACFMDNTLPGTFFMCKQNSTPLVHRFRLCMRGWPWISYDIRIHTCIFTTDFWSKELVYEFFFKGQRRSEESRPGRVQRRRKKASPVYTHRGISHCTTLCFRNASKTCQSWSTFRFCQIPNLSKRNEIHL